MADKENIEIRFFMTPASAKAMLSKFRKEKRKFLPYSFTDYYFKKAGAIAKIRKWRSKHGPAVQLIFVKRKNGLKTEAIHPVANLKKEFSNLKQEGYRQDIKIQKKKAWLITKSGKPIYAIEFVHSLGWTGEIEVPEKDKKRIKGHLQELKWYGATDFSKKSLFELYKERTRK